MSRFKKEYAKSVWAENAQRRKWTRKFSRVIKLSQSNEVVRREEKLIYCTKAYNFQDYLPIIYESS